ncbi:Serine--tRNA ligase, mitochondrial [Ascosphaera aggregata]|nr:Serine--tRNA ligase, mitochondrial [Ascosphaera aggregata]
MSTKYSRSARDANESRSPEEFKRTKFTKVGDHKALLHDVFSGTGFLAQAGALLLTGLVWKQVLSSNINLFSLHPVSGNPSLLLNSLALFLASQSTLLLQPTHTDAQRYRGTWAHFLLNTGAGLALLSAFAVIETIKSTRPETRFRTVHSILGMTTYIAVLIQALIGVAQFFMPKLLGGERNAHKVYKWHRLLGYSILFLSTLTVIAATRTSYNLRVLQIPTSGVFTAVAFIMLGIGFRIERAKLPGGDGGVSEDLNRTGTVVDKRKGSEVAWRTSVCSASRHIFPSSPRYIGITASLRNESTTARSPPPTAPKPVLNTRHIRDNVEVYAKNCRDRNHASLAGNAAEIKRLLEEAATLQSKLNAPRARIKQVEKSIARVRSSEAAKEEMSDERRSHIGQDAQELVKLLREAQELKAGAQAMRQQREQNLEQAQRLALSLPNMTSPETPIGDDPKLVRYMNYNPSDPSAWINSHCHSHVDIGTSLGLLDFSSSATSTGWGFYFLINEAALLEHALVQYALSVALRRGWKAVSPPSIVYSHIAAACGFQPRDQNGEQQIWSIEQSQRDNAKPQRSLAGTAEIPLAAMYANREIEASKLPLKFVGASRCYRAEAGARGVDTKGLYRVHEFTKVELFGWTDVTADSNAKPPSTELFEELHGIQIEILSSLGLPCRILEMPSTDLGASATRKRDIEALFPSRIRKEEQVSPSPGKTTEELIESGWGELTSASICTDYQSRRLGTRIANRTSQKGKLAAANNVDLRFPHTINGTAMAIPRTIAAILEHGYDEHTGVVKIPEVLWPFMGGRGTIGSRN